MALNKYIKQLNDLKKDITLENLHIFCGIYIEYTDQYSDNEEVRLDSYYSMDDLEAIVIAMRKTFPND